MELEKRFCSESFPILPFSQREEEKFLLSFWERIKMRGVTNKK
jgi:hypothetical protein